MLGALIIVFREVIEAGLIVGIVLAATRGVAHRGLWVTIGVAGGVVGASIVAMFAGVISDAFQGSGQELFNASVLGVAVIMLMWHNAWMARHGREIADEMRRVGAAVSEGAKPLTALAVVVGLAVLREGSEVVLFLYGILASGTTVSAAHCHTSVPYRYAGSRCGSPVRSTAHNRVLSTPMCRGQRSECGNLWPRPLAQVCAWPHSLWRIPFWRMRWIDHTHVRRI